MAVVDPDAQVDRSAVTRGEDGEIIFGPDHPMTRSFAAAANRMIAEGAVRQMIRHTGDDPQREGLKGTPERVVRALEEMTAGYREDPAAILATMFSEKSDEVVVLRDIEFYSMCEHHMLPFHGVAHVGYLPGDRVVGLSKLARLVDCFARRLQIQERMTNQIADAIVEHVAARGVGVVVRARHACMGARGVRKPTAEMTTSAMRGVFLDNPPARAEFLRLVID